MKPPSYNRTDRGNAERFADCFSKIARYSEAIGWMVWDKKRWCRKKESVKGLAMGLTNMMEQEAHTKEAEEGDVALKHAFNAQSSKNIMGMINLVKGMECISANPEDFDSRPWLLNCDNGVLDLRNGKLFAHDSKYMMTMVSKAEYDPHVGWGDRWQRFIEEITGGDHEMQNSLQQMAGYSLTGNISERCMFILYGDGNNGKNVFMDSLAHMLGGFGLVVAPETLMIKQKNGVPNDVAMMNGRRFVTASETDSSDRLNEPLVKSLTGDNRLTARFLRQEYFEFTPAFKIWLATNKKPIIKGTDTAIWNRLRLIRFEEVFSGDAIDPFLMRKLEAKSELSGMLNWALDGCLAWQANKCRLKLSQKIYDETEGYRMEQDSIANFIVECLAKVPGYSEYKSVVYAAYKHWAEREGLGIMSHRRFSQEMAGKGFAEHRKAENRCWRGLKVGHEEEEVVQGDAFASERKGVWN